MFSLGSSGTVCLNPKCHGVVVTGPAPWSLTAVPSAHLCLGGAPHPVPHHSLRTRFRITLRSCPEQSWFEEPTGKWGEDGFLSQTST